MESIKRTAQSVYEEMPRIFRAPDFCKEVRSRMKDKKRSPMDGTILRRLRELRAAGEAPYKVFDSHKSLYKKI